jgi:predicted HTH transcriptional regulator
MANNKGGQIIFGIQDKPRLPFGMTNDKFTNCDPAKIKH